MRKTLETLQNDLQTDILGFGIHLHRFHPNLWEPIKKEWDTGINYFSQIETDIKVKVTIERPGNINRTSLNGGNK